MYKSYGKRTQMSLWVHILLLSLIAWNVKVSMEMQHSSQKVLIGQS